MKVIPIVLTGSRCVWLSEQKFAGGILMKVIIDRFEGEYAVVELESGEFADMPKMLVPSLAEEGDVLEISIDENETARRKNRISEMMKDMQQD
jgi:hypothetical protein